MREIKTDIKRYIKNEVKKPRIKIVIPLFSTLSIRNYNTKLVGRVSSYLSHNNK